MTTKKRKRGKPAFDPDKVPVEKGEIGRAISEGVVNAFDNPKLQQIVRQGVSEAVSDFFDKRFFVGRS